MAHSVGIDEANPDPHFFCPGKRNFFVRILFWILFLSRKGCVGRHSVRSTKRRGGGGPRAAGGLDPRSNDRVKQDYIRKCNFQKNNHTFLFFLVIASGRFCSCCVTIYFFKILFPQQR